MDAKQDQLREAAQVREDHRTGMCTECWGIGPCHRYAAWFPIIAELPPRSDPVAGRPEGVVVVMTRLDSGRSRARRGPSRGELRAQRTLAARCDAELVAGDLVDELVVACEAMNWRGRQRTTPRLFGRWGRPRSGSEPDAPG